MAVIRITQLIKRVCVYGIFFFEKRNSSTFLIYIYMYVCKKMKTLLDNTILGYLYSNR